MRKAETIESIKAVACHACIVLDDRIEQLGSLVIPESADLREKRATVSSVGTAKYFPDTGRSVAPTFEEGDRVFVHPNQVKQIRDASVFDDIDLWSIPQEDVIGIIIDEGDEEWVLACGYHVIVKMDEAESHQGLIEIPDGAREEPKTGTVVSAGPGQPNEKTGKMEWTELHAGNRIILYPRLGKQIRVRGEDLWTVEQKDVLGIVSDD